MPARTRSAHGAPRGKGRRVRVAILSTGSEILQGLYPDTNAQWLAARLDTLGFDVVASRVVGDDLALTAHALRALGEEVDLIVSTGGLGPTEDDVYREACAEAWDRPLVYRAGLMREIEERYLRTRRKMPESNRRQAHIPRGAQSLSNAWGTAPGFAFRRSCGRAALIALPGPPAEMRPMLEKRALAWLQGHLWPGVARGRTVIHTLGWSESRMNERLADLFQADPRLSVTMLARSGKIDIRLTATAPDESTVKDLLTRYRHRVRRRLPRQIVWGRDDETLEENVNRLLARHGLTVAVAESCTGGLVAERLTRVPGASRVLAQSVVTYSDGAKAKILGVKRTTLRRHGAVSEACVREMAEGVRRWAGADIGVSISGIAGPTGGTPDKPVGLVFIAAATRHDTVAERHRIIRHERSEIRAWSADRALNLTRRVTEDLMRR